MMSAVGSHVGADMVRFILSSLVDGRASKRLLPVRRRSLVT